MKSLLILSFCILHQITLGYYLNKDEAFKVIETDDFYMIFNAEKDTNNYVGVTWANGEQYCQNKYGTDLATVDTAAKQAQIDNVYSQNKIYYASWIGLKTANGNYVFADGTPLGSYNNWKQGYPVNAGCVMNYGPGNIINPGWEGWADWNCNENSANYICNKPNSDNNGCLGPALSCSTIVSDVQLWGRTVRGIDFTSKGYNPDKGEFTLAWVGCPSDGCSPAQFFCNEEADGISFGSSGSVLRSLMGKYASASAFPQQYQACANDGDEWSVHNAPMTDTSADQMCKELGYKSGVVIDKVNSNYCPEPEYNPTSKNWETDLEWSQGWGKSYRCKGKCDGNAEPPKTNSPTSDPTASPVQAPTKSPTSNPTEPVMLVDNVCELLDIDFFLNECSLHHNGLKSNLAKNDAAHMVLEGRVTTLEGAVTADKTNLQNQIDGIQTQINDLTNTIQTSFGNLATSLGNLGKNSAKTVPIFNDNGEIIGEEELFFTTLQEQWLIILSLFMNCVFIIGTGLYCFIMYASPTKIKQNKFKKIPNFDSSDSEAMSH